MSGDINVQSFSGKVNISNNLLVGSSHLFVDTVNNRVGITTASPGASLEVNGNVHVETDLTLGGILTGDGSGLANVNSDSGLWAGAGTGSVYLSTSTDKVGIGTTSPQQKLDLGDLGGGSIRLGRDHDDDNTSTNRIGRTGVGNAVWYASVDFLDENTNDDAISFTTHESGIGATEKMRISGNGNVGIGTSTPTQILDVGSSLSNPFICRHLSGSLHAADKRDNVSFGRIDGSDFSGMKCRVDTHTAIGYGDYANQTKIGFFTWGSNYANSREVMSILGNGKVGVGATIPDVKFQVEGTSSSHQKLTKLATWNIFHHRDDSGFEHLITYGGSDGQAYFDNRDNFMYVQIPAFSGETLYTSTVSGYNSGYFNARFRDLNGNKPNLAENTTYKVHAYSSRIDAFGTITTAGNVGINKTDPTYNLDVSGNLRVTSGILDTSWCSGSWLQTCTQSPTVTVYSNNGGGPMSTPGHGGTGMGGNRGRFTAKKAGNYLISCCAIHSGRGDADASGSNLLVVFDAVGTHWNLNNVINTYDEIIDLRVAPSVEEAYTFACQVYMNVGHYFSFRVHSSGYTDGNAKLLCSAALVR